MAKDRSNRANVVSIYSNPTKGGVYGVIFQNNGVLRRKINTHSKKKIKKLDNE